MGWIVGSSLRRSFFWVPGIGPLLVAGPLTASIVAALESAVVVGGLSVLGAGLYGMGSRRTVSSDMKRQLRRTNISSSVMD